MTTPQVRIASTSIATRSPHTPPPETPERGLRELLQGSPEDSQPRIEPIPQEITAYAGYQWDARTHRLTSPPAASRLPAGYRQYDYSGFRLGLCRGGGVGGPYVSVRSGPDGEDQFSPEDLHQLEGLMGVGHTSNRIILDQESDEPGRICLEASDPHRNQMDAENLDDRNCLVRLADGLINIFGSGACEDRLGQNNLGGAAALCQAVRDALESASRETSVCREFRHSTIGGGGFGAGMGGVTAAGLLGAFIFRKTVSAWLKTHLPWLFSNNNDNRRDPPDDQGPQTPGPTPQPRTNPAPRPAASTRTSFIITGATVLAESAAYYIPRIAPRLLAGFLNAAGTTAALVTGLIAIRPSCDTELGILTNPECGGGGA